MHTKHSLPLFSLYCYNNLKRRLLLFGKTAILKSKKIDVFPGILWHNAIRQKDALGVMIESIGIGVLSLWIFFQAGYDEGKRL